MDTTTLVVIGIIVGGLALAGGGYLFVLRKGQQGGKEEVFFHFRCPGCKHRLRFQARQSGNKGQCSRCGQTLVFPPVGQSID